MICTQDVSLQQAVCSILVHLELMLPFFARDLILALVPACLSVSGHTAFQHVSGSTVNSSRNFNFHITEIVGPFIEVQ